MLAAQVDIVRARLQLDKAPKVAVTFDVDGDQICRRPQSCNP